MYQNLPFLCRFEVKRLPAVVTSAVDPRTFDEDQTQGYSGYDTTEAALTNCPEGYKPSLHWIKHFLTAFVQLRQRLQQCVFFLSFFLSFFFLAKYCFFPLA